MKLRFRLIIMCFVALGALTFTSCSAEADLDTGFTDPDRGNDGGNKGGAGSGGRSTEVVVTTSKEYTSETTQ